MTLQKSDPDLILASLGKPPTQHPTSLLLYPVSGMRGRWPGLCWVTFRKSDFPPALIFPRVYAQQSQPPSEKLVTQKCYVPRTERHLSLCWLTVAPQKTPHWLFCPLCTLLPLLTDFWFTPGQDKWGPHLCFRLVICIVSGNLQMDLQGSNSLAKICMREKLSVSCALSVFDLWHLKLLYVINYPSSSSPEPQHLGAFDWLCPQLFLGVGFNCLCSWNGKSLENIGTKLHQPFWGCTPREEKSCSIVL